MSRAKNPVWDYFRKLDSDQSKAVCLECDKILSLGSDKPRQQTVSGLKCHLSTCHKDINVMYLKRVADNESDNAAKKMKVVSETKVVTTHVQPTLKAVNERRVEWSDDNIIAQRIDKCIVDMIIVDMLPFTIVEGEAFKRLNFCDPLGPRRYRLKSEKYYRMTLMPATYDKVVEKVQMQLNGAQWLSFTTDIWSNPTKTCSLLSFTGHFLDGPVRRKIVLGAMVLEEDHTAVYLASKLNEAMQKWGIQPKMHVGVRDNAANMISAMRHANITDIGCTSHTLQLVLRDGIFIQTSVEAVVKKARKIVGHFKHSEQACRHLKEFQVSRDVPEHKLIQDVETRWNSTYLMLERLVEQQKAINLYSVERGGIETLSNTEWELAERIVNILKPFYAATLELSADEACVSMVIPLVAMLSGKLQAGSADRGLLQMKAALRDAMDRRFTPMRSSPPVIAATFLDPRFKDAYFTAQEKAAAVTEITQFLKATQQPLNPTSDADEMTTNVDEAVADTGDLWSAHDSLRAEPATSVTDTTPLYEQQLAAYMKEPRVPRTTNIYAYWHNSQFPELEPAARKYLSAPATSVASEQLFSSAGQLYADRRSSLLGENAEKHLFLAYNIRLFDFSY